MPTTTRKEGQKDEQHGLMWQFLNDGYNYHPPQRGDIRKGHILRVTPGEVIVDIGAKRDAIIPEKDLKRLSEEEIAGLRPGDEIEVYILNPRTRDEELIVSLNLALEEKEWARAERFLESGEVIEGEITGHNKGGLLTRFGRIQGFVPASHVVGLHQPAGNQQRWQAQYVGETLPLKVIEVDRQRRRLILSNREAQSAWEEKRRAQLMEELAVGEVRRGTVVGLADFGAFIDLDGATGLAHISELAWGEVRHPKDVLEIGAEVDVYVLGLDPERNRIALSLKRLQPNPWQTVPGHYDVGAIIEGKVVNIVDFGVFVQVEPGIEGLIHVSELSDQHVDHPSQIVQKGDVVEVEIIDLDPDHQRMGLRLRRLAGSAALPSEESSVEQVEAPAEGN